MPLTEINFALSYTSNRNFPKCFTVGKVTVLMKLVAWPTSLRALWADPSVPAAPQDWHLPRYMSRWFAVCFIYLFVFNRVLLFHDFWFLRISEPCLIVFSKFLPHLKGVQKFFVVAFCSFVCLFFGSDCNLWSFRSSMEIGFCVVRFRSHNKFRRDSKEQEKGLLVPLWTRERAQWVQLFGAQTKMDWEMKR